MSFDPYQSTPKASNAYIYFFALELMDGHKSVETKAAAKHRLRQSIPGPKQARQAP